VILLLDAHALLWWLGDDATLHADARAAIASPANDVLVSAATVWEIEIKRALGKLEAPDGLVDAIEASAFQGLPISLEDAERAGRLPPHHRDPFDRMLVVQAMRLDAVIVSRDDAFAPYELEVLRA
jgi:PIN domain nuclease of toxin-antitoxin system